MLVHYDHCTIHLSEITHPDYACYLWPSALVLAEYLHFHRTQLVTNQVILEVLHSSSHPQLQTS
jgi:predicted nicotinamide N-methyase